MRLQIEATNDRSFSGGLTAIAVTRPFDRSENDLGIPDDAALLLIAEAKRVAFDGTLGEAVAIHTADGWFALVGAGPSPKATDYRRVGARAVKLAGQFKVQTLLLTGAELGERARFAVEGMALTGYAFDRYKSEPEQTLRLERALIYVDAQEDARVTTGVELAASVNAARDLANEHPGRCTPRYIAHRCKDTAERYGFSIKIRNKKKLEKDGFGLILAVAQGSEEPPRFVHMTYTGEGEIKRRIVLVGKGVTYDSGGYSMKSPEAQLNMHLDMGGAAAVYGAAEAIGRLKPPGVEVHFLIPAVENLVSGSAYKLNEIVRSYNGKTVEIRNTDAEGRLILADALAYAQELGADEVIDLATLTGACVVALGTETAGVFSNDDAMAARVLAAAATADESMWRMPLTERIESQLRSDVADMKNIGSRWGGAISAALFLRKFAGEMPWTHIDIAGPAMTDAAWEYINQGGTGFGALALYEYVRAAGE